MAGEWVGGSQPAPPAPPYLPGWSPGRDRLAGAPRLGDARLDLTRPKRELECSGGIAAVGPQLLGVDPELGEGIQER